MCNLFFRGLIFVYVFLISSGIAWAQYQVNGAASQTSCNCFELTPNVQNVGGSVWNVNQIDLNNPFDFNFQVWLGCDEWGADGIGFVLQPVNINQGGIASSLGFGGIVPSLVVEIDTWPNDVTMNDPPEDHIAILQNGNTNHSTADNLAGPVTASSTQNDIEDCQWHDVQIIWNPTINTLAVFFDGVFRTSYTGNVITNIFGNNPNVYWGWTGGTGGASADQAFCNTLEPSFTQSNNASCVGEVIQLEDASVTSTGNISNYSWNFGDGSTTTGNPVSHTYSSAGNFDVELTITAEGCTETTIIPVTIDPVPVVNLGPDLDICSGESVQLNSPNSLGSGTYSWSPTTALSNAAAPSPTCSASSTTQYTLTYTSNNNCSASDNVTVNVNPPPIANAGADQTMCENSNAQLQASGGVTYSWAPSTGLSDPNISNPSASPTSTITYTVTVTDANGCEATDDVTITVVQAPSLDAGMDETICEGDDVQLNAIGTGTFIWSPIGGLDNASIQNPLANPTVTTTYYATLTDANNCSAVDSVVVNVEPIPVADFPDPPAACDGSPVNFTDNSTGFISTYSWDFGDTQTGSGANPQHIYPGIGTYNVSLMVSSPNGCSSSTTGTAQVVNGPTPNFAVTNGPDLCVGEELEISDNSSGPIASYGWDFDDGTTSSLTSPTHAYANVGAYSITVTLTAPDQCATSQVLDVVVYPNPIADFAADQGCEEQATVFLDASTVSSGTIQGWEWTFGDATPLEYGDAPTHTYASLGTYNVTLIAQTDAGCRDTVTHPVGVNPTPSVSISVNNSCLGDEVTFANSTVPNDNTIASWSWQFGDGTSSDEFEPTHQYGTLGTVTAQLMAVSDSGCVGTGTTDLEVYPHPQTNFSFSDYEGCIPMAVSFTNESTINPNYSIGSYLWDFGNGVTSTEMSPSHTYVTSGNFDVSLITTTAVGGCADTLAIADLMHIFLTPTASFHYSPTNATMLDPRIHFTNTSIDAANYEWDFGDGNTSTIANPMNGYPAEGDYIITLVALNGICTSTTSQEVHIDPETFVYIPNSFTPNGDGLNDYFIPKGIGIEKFSMTIYNRWGEELFYTNTLDEPWRGWYKGAELPNDTYVYQIDIIDVLGEPKTYRGGVTLVR
jgi:gliding motility-associated-like protein